MVCPPFGSGGAVRGVHDLAGGVSAPAAPARLGSRGAAAGFLAALHGASTSAPHGAAILDRLSMRLVRDNGLTIVLMLLFGASIVGQLLAGWHVALSEAAPTPTRL